MFVLSTCHGDLVATPPLLLQLQLYEKQAKSKTKSCRNEIVCWEVIIDSAAFEAFNNLCRCSQSSERVAKEMAYSRSEAHRGGGLWEGWSRQVNCGRYL